MKSDGGCDYRELENGYCINIGKVMEYDKTVCCTTCDKCWHGNGKERKGA